MSANVLSESKVSRGFLTVVPREVRRKFAVQEGDQLEWSLHGTELMVRIRKRKSIGDLIGLGSHGGNSVASKRAVQGLERRVR
jgi:bifunctional DNA-binding transcriptional regulator/antitoxin component of YhaV-PrlF toxin-antitoxin module